MAGSRSLGTLSIDLVAKIGGWQNGLTKAQREADKNAAAIERRLQKMGKVIDAAFAVAAASIVAASTAIFVGVGRAIDRMDEIGKSSQKIGVTTESLSKLAFAAQLADVEFSQLEGALVKLSKSQDAAAQGTEEQLAIFKALNVEFQNADGTLRKTDEVFSDLADSFQRLPDGANKTAAALALFGRSGAQLIPLLNAGSEGIKDAGDELERFGGVVTPKAAAEAEQFNDDITRLRTAVDGLWVGIAKELLPDLIRLVEGFKDGAKEGDGFKTTAVQIADGIKGVADVAVVAFNVIKALTLQLAGFTAGVAKFLATYTLPGRIAVSADQRQALEDFSAVSFAGAQEAAAVIEGGDSGVSPFSGSRGGRGAATRDPANEAIREAEANRALAATLDQVRTQKERDAEARKAQAAAARALAEAERELQRIRDEGLKAQAEITETIEQNAAQMAGPAAQAARAYADELVRLVGQQEKLRAANLLTADTERELAIARQQAFDQYQEQLTEIEEKRTEAARGIISDLNFELELLGKTNLEREKAIALRYANVDAASAEGMAIVEAMDALDQAAQVAEGLDVVRQSTQGLFQDLMDGSKSAKDAFMDFVDSILAGIAQIVARNLTEQLLGSFGSTGGGASGGGLASLFGAFFGGGRATGGTVYPGKAYLVGEQGPELVVPNAMGNVMSADKTSAMMRRGGTNVTFVLPGRNDLRTEQQRQADLARATSRQLSRATA